MYGVALSLPNHRDSHRIKFIYLYTTQIQILKYLSFVSKYHNYIKQHIAFA
jgi:hypothetical protein